MTNTKREVLITLILTVVSLCTLSSEAEDITDTNAKSQNKPITPTARKENFSQDSFNFPPPTSSQITKKISVAASRYYVAIVNADSSKGSIPYRDISGNPISDNVTPKDWCRGAIEGSILTTFNGKRVILNFVNVKNNPKFNVNCVAIPRSGSSKHDGKSRYKITNARYGLGTNNWFLVPYRTIAVDSKYIKYGSVIFIPKARGKLITLPSGEKIHHDGYFFAGDRGNSEKIKGERIDIFCTFDENCLHDVATSTHEVKFPMDAQVITNPEIEAELKQRHIKE